MKRFWGGVLMLAGFVVVICCALSQTTQHGTNSLIVSNQWDYFFPINNAHPMERTVQWGIPAKVVASWPEDNLYSITNLTIECWAEPVVAHTTNGTWVIHFR